MQYLLQIFTERGFIEMSEALAMRQERTAYFYCYNPKLRKFLGLSGLRWAYKGFNNKTHKYYWTFERNEELNNLIKVYKMENSNS